MDARVRTLFRVMCCLLVAVLASTSLTGCRRWRARRRGAAPVSASVVRGRALYQRYCALCHGQQLQGYAADHANAIGNAQFLSIASNAFLRSAITHGRPGTPMSAWGKESGGPLIESEVNDLVAFIRSHARRPFRNVDRMRVAGDADNGRLAYVQHCAPCHGDRGQGSDRAPSLAHPNLLNAVSDGYLKTTILEGRPGTVMASFRTLPEQTVNDVVRFIRTLDYAPPIPPAPVFEPPPGLDRLVMNPTGAAPVFTLREGRFVPGAQVLEAIRQNRRLVILDTRATSDWSRGHITGALPFPFYDIEEMARHLPRDGTWIVAYCACPHAASGHVVDLLRERGFQHAVVLDEGITWWTNQGYPTAQAAQVRP